MKKIIIILALSITSFVVAQIQTLHNFNLSEDLTVNYQYIFENKNNISISELQIFLKTKSNLQDIEIEETIIYGKIGNMRVNYELYGGKYMSTLILLNHDLVANFKIELKDNRYRLTVNNLTFIDRSSEFASSTLNSDINRTKLDDYLVIKRKQAFRNNKTITKGLEYIDQHFKDFFKYEKSKKSDW